LKILRVFPPAVRSALAAGSGLLNGRVAVSEKLADLLQGQPTVRSVALALRRSLSNERLAALGLPVSRTVLAPDYLDRDVATQLVNTDDTFNIIAQTEATHYMGDTLLRDTDSNSMKQSLEVRVPFLDLPVVDYVSALPGHIKSGQASTNKPLLRMACQRVIRDDISRRPKTGFTLPIGAWMRHEMRESCEEAIARVESLPFLETTEVRRIWNAFQANERTMHWSRPLALVVPGAAIR
jgi:asparagine synthase (glutamine-hydrolysing)